ncbi:unnamed protein product, partial [Arabidopsis halleri]
MSFERASQQETIKSSNGQQNQNARRCTANTGGSFHSYLSSRRCTFS